MNEEEQSADKDISNEQNQTSQNMEPHIHPHIHHEKKWKDYLLEFIMIFLAVTLSFFAESYREHILNQAKEKDYMKSMLVDLRNDSAQLSILKLFYIKVEANYDSVSQLLKTPVTVSHLLKAYRLTAAVDDIINFDYSNRTVSELKSSGDFRLIKSKPVADGIIDYDAFIVNNYHAIEEAYRKTNLNVEQLRHKVFNYEIFNKMGTWSTGKLGAMDVSFFKHAPIWNNDSLIIKLIESSDKTPGILNRSEFLSQFRNELQATIRLINYGPMYGFIVLQEKNEGLIKVAQQKYHLQ